MKLTTKQMSLRVNDNDSDTISASASVAESVTGICAVALVWKCRLAALLTVAVIVIGIVFIDVDILDFIIIDDFHETMVIMGRVS